MSNLGPFTWSIADQFRGVYKPHQYGSIVLPLTILRRLDALMASTRDEMRTLATKHEPSAKMQKACPARPKSDGARILMRILNRYEKHVTMLILPGRHTAFPLRLALRPQQARDHQPVISVRNSPGPPLGATGAR